METNIALENKIGTATTTAEKKSSFLSWVIFLVVTGCLFLLIKYAISFTVISGNSMNPTLEDGDVLLTNQIAYTVETEDIVVYRDEGGFHVIKRVIGLPGDRVAIEDGVVFVNGEALEEAYTTGLSIDMPEMVVPDHAYFLVGDNRVPGASLDSRSEQVGAINEEQIIGEAVVSLLPFGGL
ncbi:signal peptidase I [Ornithinibacillus contaminans]|uniref:signal peptidase I n=1 Tax=Ornithinibacillus contaminans TaxID=694055 RepID=UPI00064DAB9D|nr:signal peptidase I [Ornithinibacillus contaminans]